MSGGVEIADTHGNMDRANWRSQGLSENGEASGQIVADNA